MEMGVVYPDGQYELLLSVPNYDFNWQTSYTLSEPKLIPAGSKLIQHNWWDNSGQNKANPNPNIEVRWGQQSFEEMLFGAFMIDIIFWYTFTLQKIFFCIAKLGYIANYAHAA